MKTCSKCRETKPVSEYQKDKTKASGYKSQCKECRNPVSAHWRANNPGYQKQWHAERHEYNRQYSAARRVSDPLEHRRLKGAYRARHLGLRVEKFDSNDLLAYWESVGIDPARCFYTGELLGEGWHLDHMTPLSRGGAHAVDNLVPCTPAANLAKQNLTADEYMSRKAVAA